MDLQASIHGKREMLNSYSCRASAVAHDDGMVTIRIDDSSNPAFWQEIHLTSSDFERLSRDRTEAMASNKPA